MASKKVKAISREAKQRMNSVQKKMRRQQILMAVVGIILALSMVLALVLK